MNIATKTTVTHQHGTVEQQASLQYATKNPYGVTTLTNKSSIDDLELSDALKRLVNS
jgi:hypothetical protein